MHPEPSESAEVQRALRSDAQSRRSFCACSAVDVAGLADRTAPVGTRDANSRRSGDVVAPIPAPNSCRVTCPEIAWQPLPHHTSIARSDSPAPRCSGWTSQAALPRRPPACRCICAYLVLRPDPRPDRATNHRAVNRLNAAGRRRRVSPCARRHRNRKSLVASIVRRPNRSSPGHAGPKRVGTTHAPAMQAGPIGRPGPYSADPSPDS